MAVRPTQSDYDLIQLRQRNIKIKIDVLNFDFETVESLESKVVSGSISVDATSDIRRTCKISMVIDKEQSIISPRW